MSVAVQPYECTIYSVLAFPWCRSIRPQLFTRALYLVLVVFDCCYSHFVFTKQQHPNVSVFLNYMLQICTYDHNQYKHSQYDSCAFYNFQFPQNHFPYALCLVIKSESAKLLSRCVCLFSFSQPNQPIPRAHLANLRSDIYYQQLMESAHFIQL